MTAPTNTIARTKYDKCDMIKQYDDQQEKRVVSIIIDEEEAAHASAGPSSYRTTPWGNVPSWFILKMRYPTL